MIFLRKYIVKLSFFLVILCFSVSMSIGIAKGINAETDGDESKEISTQTTKDQAKEKKVTFNFVDVELSTVTKFISEITGKNFIFDDRVKGNITIIAPSKLSVDDAYSLFTSVLELKGFTVVPSGVDAYKIIPAIEAKQSGMQIDTENLPVNESYIARLIPLKHISSDDALRFLQQIVSKDGHISDFGPGNLLLIIDSGLNVDKILSIIQSIDQPLLREEPELVILKHASADIIAKILNEGIFRSSSGRIRPVPGQAGQAEEPKVVADQRLNAVILFGDKITRDSLKKLISLLDVPSPGTHGMINVYFLENADATELSKVLEGMLRGQPTRPVTTPGQAGAPPVAPFEAVSGINITPDKATNSLIIVASPADYQNILQVIKQLDRRRKQVYVEAMIIEASIDKLQELGSKWRITAEKDGEPIFIGGVGKIDQAAFQSILSGLTGLTAGGMGNFLDVPVSTIDTDGTITTSTLTIPGFSALFSLNEFKGAINVLSTPQILTSDNKEAEIIVGENVPFIAKSEANAAQPDSIFNTIERKDVGITLRITPQITEGNFIKLDIYQEISALVKDSIQFAETIGPTTTKRSTKTSVVVKDEQTVVIGGLMEEREEENVTKVPLFGDIPLLGWLFKNKSIDKKKTNLLVFLTPHIVRDSEQLSQMTEGKKTHFAKRENMYKQGELLLKFKENTDEKRIMEIISSEGASIISAMKIKGLYLIMLKKDQEVEDAVEEFTEYEEVEYAEPNYIMKIK